MDMDFIFSRHACEQMLRRDISRKTVMMVISCPDHAVVENETSTKIIYQSLINEDNRTVLESDEEKKGVILDFSADGYVIGIEILNASKQVGNPARMEYELA
jgi:uncharacterized protein YuzE